MPVSHVHPYNSYLGTLLSWAVSGDRVIFLTARRYSASDPQSASSVQRLRQFRTPIKLFGRPSMGTHSYRGPEIRPAGTEPPRARTSPATEQPGSGRPPIMTTSPGGRVDKPFHHRRPARPCVGPICAIFPVSGRNALARHGEDALGRRTNPCAATGCSPGPEPTFG